MALFKILKGPEYETVNSQKVSRLPSTYHEGYCYFATDTHKFYIDISSENDPSSRVELNAYLADYAVRTYYDEQGDSFLNDYVKGGKNANVRANETVVTTTKVINNQTVPQITSRKLVDGYTIVEELPTGANADQNVVYLIEDGEDSGGGSGGGRSRLRWYLRDKRHGKTEASSILLQKSSGPVPGTGRASACGPSVPGDSAAHKAVRQRQDPVCGQAPGTGRLPS